jgi:hypothetical protein
MPIGIGDEIRRKEEIAFRQQWRLPVIKRLLLRLCVVKQPNLNKDSKSAVQLSLSIVNVSPHLNGRI